MESVVQLSPTDILAERPFTHPDHIPDNLNTLRYMARHLQLTLSNPDMMTNYPHTILHNMPGNNSWIHRQVLANPSHFEQPNVIHVVGFFGQSRSQADIELAQEFDKTLLQEIPQHDGLISYSTMLLKDGNYANLVLFTSEDAQMGWGRSEAHAKAVYELSPGFYHSIRIYNGRLPHGIQQSDNLRLHKARYFDYDQTPMWRGVRIIE
ncbi:MAG: hypothetical protein DHS20C20_30830 [Ardenticatenaceae bacterium]|nr:MAG: hypothetical protein DHS20C20_30830 [Ardenticatenaceae bacterium]